VLKLDPHLRLFQNYQIETIQTAV